MLQEVVQPRTTLQLDIDLAFPTILMPSWPVSSLEAGRAASASASVAVIELGRMYYTTAQPSASDCRPHQVAYQMQLLDLNLSLCGAQELQGAAQGLAAVLDQHRTHRRSIIENSFNAIVDVTLTSSQDADEEMRVGNGDGEGAGMESVFSVVTVKMVVQPLAVCAAASASSVPWGLLADASSDMSDTCTWYPQQVRLAKDEFLHATAVADTFAQVLQAGQMTGSKRAGGLGDPGSRKRKADQRRALDKKKAAFARAAMAERLAGRHTLESQARPASSASDRKPPAQSTLELVLQCDSISVSLITNMSGEADTREQRAASGSAGAAECGQHILKLILGGLDLAAQRAQVRACMSLSLARECAHAQVRPLLAGTVSGDGD
jgi:hypothetical protein